jgi:hypothetical protein
MNRCPSCDYPLPFDRERLGARCPNCRDPLYEPAGHVSRFAREGEGACAVHAGREAAGTCGRCGNFFCEVCRTRWRDRILCAACAERALASREATPEQERAHYRQALFGLLMGLGAWAMFVFAQAIVVGVLVSGVGRVLILFGFLFMVGSMLLGVIGMGQAAAAVRTRGPYMGLAVAGTIVDGLFLGVFIGNYLVPLWIS